jgi:chemotaxis regulatin CheY-phosphate phosphatase CheZ
MDKDHSDEASKQKAEDPHSHEIPATVEAAIAQLKKVTSQVRQALKSGETDKADSLVHSIGHLMEDLNEKIAAAKIDEKVKDAATAASDTIFEAYGQIDEALHAAEDEIKKIDFSSFGPTINKATKNLEALLLEAKDTVVGEKPKKEEQQEGCRRQEGCCR